MRRIGLITLGLVTASPLLAQDAAENHRHSVAPGNSWSIDDNDCAIDTGWDGDVSILITLHEDHHDFGIYNPHFIGVVDGEVIGVRFGTGGPAARARAYRALGRKDSEATSYVSDVDSGLLDRIAATNSFQAYRGATTLVDLDMTGFRAALGLMRACEGAMAAAAASNAADAMAAAAASNAADAMAEAADNVAMDAASNAMDAAANAADAAPQ